MCGINHLAGLDLDRDALSDLDPDERDALAALRRHHDDGFDRETAGGAVGASSASEEEEEKDGSDPLSPIDRPPGAGAREPTYLLPPDCALPSSGWRPLDDATLLRYLAADRRSDGTFDVPASRARLAGALRFRRERGCDAIARDVVRDDVPETVARCRRYKVGIYAGVDRARRPVVFERLGEFFGSGNSRRASEGDWLLTYLYFLEGHSLKMRESAARHGAAVHRIVYCADLSGIVSSILSGQILNAIPVMRRIVQTVERHYPEVVERIVLFNVPSVMSASFNTVKGFLDPATASKIEMFSDVPLDRFREVMDEDVIPTEYGGRNTAEYPPTFGVRARANSYSKSRWFSSPLKTLTRKCTT